MKPSKLSTFAEISDEMGSGYTSSYFNCSYFNCFRWLSRGKDPTRLFELRRELQVFLDETSKLQDWKWLCKSAYIADIFAHLNILNLFLQFNVVSILHVEDKSEHDDHKTGSLWVKASVVANCIPVHSFMTSW
jgi:hypothetical protein